MKPLPAVATHDTFSEIRLSDQGLREQLTEAIEMYIEYREKHGFNEVAAIDLAADEIIQGIGSLKYLMSVGEMDTYPDGILGIKS